MKQVKVWDLATRAFHWLLVVAVFICFVTGEEEGLAFIVHAYAGFMVSMLLVFRIGWGVAGSRHSRFTDFVYPWAEIKNHILSVLRFKPIHYTGHNPTGGLMILVMLAVLVGSAATGTFMVVANLAWLEDVHEVLGSTMQVLVALHIGGVIVEQLLTRQKLVQAMVNGSKELPADQARHETSLVPVWRSLVLVVLVILMGVSVYDQTNYGTAVSNFSENEHSRDRD